MSEDVLKLGDRSLRSRLIVGTGKYATLDEMDAVLFRTAMSPGIREQGDCFPMIANKDGKMVVGQFGSFIGPFMAPSPQPVHAEATFFFRSFVLRFLSVDDFFNFEKRYEKGR